MGTLTAGIKEIFSSAKTTGTNVMLCGNDGTPDGHITMDNLASVLGGKYKLLRDVDCNDLGNGEYLLVGTLSNYPFVRGMLYVYTSNDSTTIYQVADNMSGLLKSRSKGLESAGWSSWEDFTLGYPTFYKDYANFSALASAMCVPLYSETILETPIINALQSAFSSAKENTKFEGTVTGYGYFIGYRGSSEGFASVLFIRPNATYIVHRNFDTSAGTWKAFAITKH